MELGLTRDRDAPPPPRLTIIERVQGDTSRIPERTSIDLLPTSELRDSAHLAALPPTADSGRLKAAVPLAVRFEGRILPTFPLRLLALHLKLSPQDIELVPGRHVLLGNRAVPVDATGAMLPDPSLRAALTRIGYADLLLEIEKKNSEIPTRFDPAIVADGIVLAGRTDPASRRPLPWPHAPATQTDQIAVAAATILTDRFLIPTPPWTGWALLGFALVLWPLIVRLPKTTALLAAIGAAGLYGLLALQLAAQWRILLPAAIPLLLTLLTLAIRWLLPRPEDA
jgi:hypothetical protein